MTDEPTYVSRDDSMMVIAHTANVQQGAGFDGLADLNAFSVTGAVSKLSQVSLDRKVVLLAATREMRAAEILAAMELADTVRIATHMDPERLDRVLAKSPDTVRTVLAAAVEADSAVQRFATEHRSEVGEPAAGKGLELAADQPILAFRRSYARGVVYASQTGIGFLDHEFQAAHGSVVPDEGIPVGLPTAAVSPFTTKGRSLRLQGAGAVTLFVTETGAFVVRRHWDDDYHDWGGPEGEFGFPTSDVEMGIQTFEGGAIHGATSTSTTFAFTTITTITGVFYDLFQKHRATLGAPLDLTWEGVSQAGTRGLIQDFAGGLVFSSTLGDFIVAGKVAECHTQSGGIDGFLGFPAYAEKTWGQRFEGGCILVSEYGVFAVPNRILDEVSQGRLGAPTSATLPMAAVEGSIQFFEHGVVTDIAGEVRFWLRSPDNKR